MQPTRGGMVHAGHASPPRDALLTALMKAMPKEQREAMSEAQREVQLKELLGMQPEAQREVQPKGLLASEPPSADVEAYPGIRRLLAAARATEQSAADVEAYPGIRRLLAAARATEHPVGIAFAAVFGSAAIEAANAMSTARFLLTSPVQPSPSNLSPSSQSLPPSPRCPHQEFFSDMIFPSHTIVRINACTWRAPVTSLPLVVLPEDSVEMKTDMAVTVSKKKAWAKFEAFVQMVKNEFQTMAGARGGALPGGARGGARGGGARGGA